MSLQNRFMLPSRFWRKPWKRGALFFYLRVDISSILLLSSELLETTQRRRGYVILEPGGEEEVTEEKDNKKTQHTWRHKGRPIRDKEEMTSD